MLGLSPIQERIFAQLQVGDTRTIDLICAIWKSHGPEDPAHVLRTHICLLNRRLRPHGWRVTCHRCAREWRESTYSLSQIPPEAGPAHKRWDPAGVCVE